MIQFQLIKWLPMDSNKLIDYAGKQVLLMFASGNLTVATFTHDKGGFAIFVISIKTNDDQILDIQWQRSDFTKWHPLNNFLK